MKLAFFNKTVKKCKVCGKTIVRGQPYVEIPDRDSNGTVRYAHRKCLGGKR